MPLLGTIGAASARGFGFLLQSGAGAFKFMGQLFTNTAQVYGGSTVNGMTLLPTQPPSKTNKAIGLVVDGDFIVQGNSAYSTNKGASWTTYSATGTYTPTGMPTGLNGSICYKPNGTKRAMSFYLEYNLKANYFFFQAIGITSTGVVSGATNINIGGGTAVRSVIYSQSLNAFYVMNWGSGIQQCQWIDGTAFTSQGVISTGQPGNYIAGISDDGLVLQARYQGFGTSYNLLKYTSADFSTFVNYGTITGDQPNSQIKSPFFWAPVNNKYYLVEAFSSGATLTIRTSTAASPQAFSFLAQINISSANIITSANLIEEANGTLWVFGQYSYNAGKAGNIAAAYTFFSTDGGATWTVKSGNQFLALAKNFTP